MRSFSAWTRGQLRNGWSPTPAVPQQTLRPPRGSIALSYRATFGLAASSDQTNAA
ncbi:MAG: hypothetical protein NTZ52_05275 [Chlamydiae bacterium]|nr:hypothetical protein [Chlamydiota bacterium]